MTRPRPGLDLFLASVLVLFLELACIRWFPAHVLFLSFFTNVMLLAGFVGMSVGCLLARRPFRHICITPVILLLALAAGLGVEQFRDSFSTVVGNPANPDVVFFGAEAGVSGELKFKVPVELMMAVFFVLVAAAHVGPGQELGRAFDRMTDRTGSYTLNLLGSVVGIAAFGAFALLRLPPVVWFSTVALLLGYFLLRPEPDASTKRKSWLAFAAAILAVAVTVPTSFGGVMGFTAGREVHWSPYYRIDFVPDGMSIITNQTGHQGIIPRGIPTMAPYDLPYLFRPELQEPGKNRRILIIGAGSGNDLARALDWLPGDATIDAVEIDPVIQSLGKKHNPDQPYADPRIVPHLNDGRNFLRTAPSETYDLVVFALVDSLVLHSGYSSLRLESFLFTEESFKDVKRVLKPDGTTAVYNYFRQAWIMARLREVLRDQFGSEPVVLIDPPYKKPGAVPLDEAFLTGGDAVFFAGPPAAMDPLRAQFDGGGAFWVPGRVAMSKEVAGRFASSAPAEKPPGTDASEQAGRPDWVAVRPIQLADSGGELKRATDDWPFLYVRRPGLPDLSLSGAGIMLAASLLLWAVFHFLTPKPPAGSAATGIDPAEWGLMLRAFLLGGGFMLIETKAVVQMALLFGSTWIVNTVVFAAILIMAVVGNLFAGRVRPTRLEPYYAGLFAALAVGVVVPLGWLLGLPPAVQLLLACLLAFAPVLFAGVIFPTTFARTKRPDLFFAANVAGSLVGGLAENASMLLGFQHLLLVATGFYALSAAFGGKRVN